MNSAAAEAASTAALAAAVQITVPIPPRLLGSLIGTLDELESVASDIVEEAEEDEDEGPRSDYEEEESDSYASVECAREFVSVVQPLLASLEERLEAAAPHGSGGGEIRGHHGAGMCDGSTGYEESSTRAHTTI